MRALRRRREETSRRANRLMRFEGPVWVFRREVLPEIRRAAMRGETLREAGPKLQRVIDGLAGGPEAA